MNFVVQVILFTSWEPLVLNELLDRVGSNSAPPSLCVHGMMLHGSHSSTKPRYFCELLWAVWVAQKCCLWVAASSLHLIVATNGLLRAPVKSSAVGELCGFYKDTKS